MSKRGKAAHVNNLGEGTKSAGSLPPIIGSVGIRNTVSFVTVGHSKNQIHPRHFILTAPHTHVKFLHVHVRTWYLFGELSDVRKDWKRPFYLRIFLG